jgi:hypothetical protein
MSDFMLKFEQSGKKSGKNQCKTVETITTKLNHKTRPEKEGTKSQFLCIILSL